MAAGIGDKAAAQGRARLRRAAPRARRETAPSGSSARSRGGACPAGRARSGSCCRSSDRPLHRTLPPRADRAFASAPHRRPRSAPYHNTGDRVKIPSTQALSALPLVGELRRARRAPPRGSAPARRNRAGRSRRRTADRALPGRCRSSASPSPRAAEQSARVSRRSRRHDPRSCAAGYPAPPRRAPLHLPQTADRRASIQGIRPKPATRCPRSTRRDRDGNRQSRNRRRSPGGARRSGRDGAGRRRALACPSTVRRGPVSGSA